MLGFLSHERHDLSDLSFCRYLAFESCWDSCTKSGERSLLWKFCCRNSFGFGLANEEDRGGGRGCWLSIGRIARRSAAGSMGILSSTKFFRDGKFTVFILDSLGFEKSWPMGLIGKADTTVANSSKRRRKLIVLFQATNIWPVRIFFAKRPMDLQCISIYTIDNLRQNRLTFLYKRQHTCSIGWARRRRRGSHGPGLELRGAGLLRFRLRVVARAGGAGDGLGLPARTTEGITTSPTARRPARSDGGPGRRSVPRRGH